MTIKIMSPKEVEDLANRLKQLNDTAQVYSQSLNAMVAQAAAPLKKKIETKINQELSEVTQLVKTKLDKPLSAATTKLQTFKKLMSVPTDPFELPGYLLTVAAETYGKPIMELTSLVQSYAEPLAKLTTELNRASTISLPNISPTTVIDAVKPDIKLSSITAAKKAASDANKPTTQEPQQSTGV